VEASKWQQILQAPMYPTRSTTPLRKNPVTGTFPSMLKFIRGRSTVLSAVMSQWIGVRDLVKLDTALHNRLDRSQYLKFVRSNALVLSTTLFPAKCTATVVQYFEWMQRRGMKAREWVISHDLETSLALDFAVHTGGPHVRRLCLSDMKEETAGLLCSVFAMCQCITTVSIEKTEYWTGLGVMRGEAQRSLRELSIVDCGTKSTRLLSRNRFPNLQKLHLVGTYTASTVNSLLQAASNLTDARLKSAQIDDTGLQILAGNAQSLKTLILSYCAAITDIGFRSLAPACTGVTALSVVGCKQLSNVAIGVFVAHCRSLESLKLRERSLDGLSAIAVRCGASLRNLSLGDLQLLANNGGLVTAVAQHCRHLQELELIKCAGITEAVISRLAVALPHLKELSLPSAEVSDAVLILIATRIPKLTFLNLYGCKGFTEGGALLLVRLLKHLLRFCIEPMHCVFTRMVLGMWMDKLPGLEICYASQSPTSCARMCCS
jgi:hypothetical protein